MLDKGLVQIYTGVGKGKTTAAFGLALRAAGQGNNVLIFQFLKPPSVETGEWFALQSATLSITLDALDVRWDLSKSLKDDKIIAEMKRAIGQVLETIAQTAEKKKYDLIILDEIVFCLSKGLAEVKDIKNIIDRKDSAVELILTGRGASPELIEVADLVTEMKKIKHPFDKGIAARRGIEF